MSYRVRARVLTLALSFTLLIAALFGAVPALAAAPGTVPDITWGTSRADIDRTIALMHDAGVQWVRTNVPWNAIEPDRPGAYNQGYLAEIDYAIGKARAAGIQVIVPVSDGVPYWASADPNKYTGADGSRHYEKTYHPSDYADYARFFAWVATRYKAMGVHAYEVWNEPNLKRFWASGVSAAEYTQMLRAAYPAIKAADPDSTVILGGLSGNDRAYLKGIYDAGGHGSFDAAGIHDYSWGDPTKCWNDSTGHKAKDAFCGIEEVRKTMVANGDSAKGIWLTEFGWSTNTGAYGVSEATQADFLTKAFTKAASYPYVQTAFWYNFRNNYWL
ncbi:MAG: polysaccharide biosynthesis protein PslG, partial [Thermoleophilaceae bacterium]|nr:polysaccharide biosynthesis protein PslG [Thermoleophilaceae bacterium]